MKQITLLFLQSVPLWFGNCFYNFITFKAPAYLTTTDRILPCACSGRKLMEKEWIELTWRFLQRKWAAVLIFSFCLEGICTPFLIVSLAHCIVLLCMILNLHSLFKTVRKVGCHSTCFLFLHRPTAPFIATFLGLKKQWLRGEIVRGPIHYMEGKFKSCCCTSSPLPKAL